MTNLEYRVWYVRNAAAIGTGHMTQGDGDMTGFTDIESVRPLGPEDDAVMADLHRTLERHGALDRFGISLLHQHFDLEEGEIMLEETNKAERLQQMRVVQAADLENVANIATAWSLESGMPLMRCTCQQSGGEHQHLGSN